MSIYGKINRVITEFEQADYWNSENIQYEKILDSITITWSYLEGYIKNIEPEYTKYFKNRLELLNPNQLLITKEMLLRAQRNLSQLKSEKGNVKRFIMLYTWLIDSLLTYNNPEEACDICQSYLYYYFDEESSMLLKECITCGCQYDVTNNKEIPLSKQYHGLRPATRQELIDIRIGPM